MNEKAELKRGEKEAIEYAEGAKEFLAGILTYLVMAVAFFGIVGSGEPVLYWVFLGSGLALVVQGLLTFEIIRFPFQHWEKRIAEKRLGRKL